MDREEAGRHSEAEGQSEQGMMFRSRWYLLEGVACAFLLFSVLLNCELMGRQWKFRLLRIRICQLALRQHVFHQAISHLVHCTAFSTET